MILAFVGQAAALAPDLDLKFKIRHRGFTHSLIALFGVWLTIFQFSKFVPLHPALVSALVFGYASHLILDMLTVQGIELFYPSRQRIKLMKLRTSSRIDYLIGALMCCGTLVCLWRIF